MDRNAEPGLAQRKHAEFYTANRQKRVVAECKRLMFPRDMLARGSTTEDMDQFLSRHLRALEQAERAFQFVKDKGVSTADLRGVIVTHSFVPHAKGRKGPRMELPQ